VALKRFLISLLIVFLSLPIVLAVSARLSLDAERRHAAATAALPLFSKQASDGLVRIRARGLEFRARVAGFAQAGPGLILLHGWPETSIMWEPLIARSAASGFRVIAFDQRGFSPGARPEETKAYAVPELVSDVLGIADAVGFERFHLVGHDWGSIVGWSTAAQHADRVVSWASLSIPHPGAIHPVGANTAPPLYVSVFRMPAVPETLFGFANRWLLHRVVYSSMPADHRAEYEAVFSEPRALGATLDWYRMVSPEAVESSPLSQPVLYVWGEHDMPVYVGPAVHERMSRFVDGPFESIGLDSGHWLIQEQEARVVDAVLKHLGRASD